MATQVEVIVGTYEDFLIGYRVEIDKKDNDKLTLTQSFATRSHTGPVKCLTVCGKFMASGGADDRIFIYDMKTRKEIQTLMHHEGTVNTVVFTPEATHILTGSDDGQLTAIRTGSWQIEGLWKKAHLGSAVTHITCHPTGKLALSMGNDKTLRTWNLVKGRLAYATNLKNRKSLGGMPDCILWSPNGELFTLCGLRVVEIWNVQTAGMIKEQSLDTKPISVCWISNSEILVGLENGKILLLNLDDKSETKYFEAHTQRVKAIDYVNNILSTVSSSGEIALWSLDSERKFLDKVASTNIGCRPTCMALLDINQFGDDYILKKEQTEIIEKENFCNLQGNKKIVPNMGNVVVEYEDESFNENIINSSENFVSESNNSKIDNSNNTSTSVKKKKTKKRKNTNSKEKKLTDNSMQANELELSKSENSSAAESKNLQKKKSKKRKISNSENKKSSETDNKHTKTDNDAKKRPGSKMRKSK